MSKAHGKYAPQKLLRMFRMAARLRQQMISAGFTDNGGAIYSAERILDVLGQRLNYPALRHRNSLKRYHKAIFSKVEIAKGTTAVDRVAALAASLARQHPDMSHDDALKAVMQRNPALADACRREQGQAAV